MPWYQAGVHFLKYTGIVCIISSELKVTIWVGLNLATIAGYQFIVRTRNGSNWWHWQPDGHLLLPSGHWAGYLTLGGEWGGWTLEYCQGGFEEDGSLGTNICSIITPGAVPVIITMMVTPPHHHSQWSTRAKSGFYDEALIKLQSNWDLLPEAICSESKLMWNTIWDRYCSPII